MTTKARTGIGAALKLGNAASPEVFTAIAGITSINGPELSSEEIEVTSLDSPGGYKEFINGLKDGGTVSITVNFSNDSQQRTLRSLVGGAARNFQLTLPTSPECLAEFAANVTSWNQTTEAAAAMTADISFKISGEPNWTP